MPSAKRRLLILGGTGEAATLANEATAAFSDRLEVVTSLAGRTRRPASLRGKVVTGGFGGAEGLTRFLRREAIDLVVDATHPFAATISAHALKACAAAGVPRLILVRQPWRRTPADRWIEVEDAAEAAAAVADLARRTFLTLGRRDLDAFSELEGVWFLVRLIEPPDGPLPLERYELVVGRGPFAVESEKRLMVEHRIEALVTKASGGHATEAKVVAAREAGLPVVMIRRPEAPPGEKVTSPAAALAWIGTRLEAV